MTKSSIWDSPGQDWLDLRFLFILIWLVFTAILFIYFEQKTALASIFERLLILNGSLLILLASLNN